MTPLKAETTDQEKLMFTALAEVSTNIIDQCVAQGGPFCKRLWWTA